MNLPTHCRTCDAALPPAGTGQAFAGWARKRGFCNNKCARTWTPTLRTVLCANITCKRGEHGARNIFTTFVAHAECCCQPCQNTYYQRRRNAKTLPAQTQTHTDARVVNGLDMRPVPGDLPPSAIEQRLAARAAYRKATRSWLRIEDPYAQRPGSELHCQADPSMGAEGALW